MPFAFSFSEVGFHTKYMWTLYFIRLYCDPVFSIKTVFVILFRDIHTMLLDFQSCVTKL